MSFPISIKANINSHSGNFSRDIELQGGLTVLIGPNGGGKTHLLRGLKQTLTSVTDGKKVRFLSAGRMGLLEQYRSDYDGQRGSNPNYESASFGSKRDTSRRHKTETLNGDFQTLSERADILIKVQERLRKLFKRDLIIEWDAGTLKVVFARLDTTSKPYSSGREASGLLHLVGILAALYDDEVGAILIDEPEVSLHPQLQAFLLNEITNAAGHPSEGGYKKLVIMATHSTEMLRISKPNDLTSLIFCHDLDKPPVQLDPNDGQLKNKKLQALIARLGQEHKLSLFCRRPLLVEGPSDVMIASFISNKLELHLEAAGSQLLPVIGKGQMPVVTKFMKLIGKDPVVLADADAFTDDMDLAQCFLANSSIADANASKLGAPSAIKLASSTFSDFCSLVNDNWSDISKQAETHPYYVNAEEPADEKVKRRAAFCTLLSLCSSAVNDLANADKWSSMKDRLTVVLDLLESSGCFILRKGAIESYYQASDIYTSEGKPTAAVDEIDYLDQLSTGEINTNLNDLVRCIEHASEGKRIDEAESLRDILLSIAAPATARLSTNDKTTTQDINILAKTILGERANIFNCSVEDGKLVIDIESEILNVSGFPVTIDKNGDVVKIIERVLCSNA
ncbi:AAA family ATPase [Pseudoalteromonas issachenkonii]|uniref:AAA family ATPase n=1 Tax=Pseudoalteromonas issachenkonii TaxID=152297 RepID=A0ABU9GUW4_9GAMM